MKKPVLVAPVTRDWIRYIISGSSINNKKKISDSGSSSISFGISNGTVTAAVMRTENPI